jgi:hypothetical protein
MKTLSEHPLLIGRLLSGHEKRRARRRARHGFWRSPWLTLSLFLIWVTLLAFLVRAIVAAFAALP